MFSENKREYNRRVREIVEQSWTADWYGSCMYPGCLQSILCWGCWDCPYHTNLVCCLYMHVLIIHC
jgi:RsiW-degrading membrane proteinase PrsW (M82 family)